ncbi:MAG: response regulator [Gammaproteobacteria bacterium]|jgi:signal transduction histidine kinase/chemotaxis response regulator CheB|nr:response regulator [Gammaproteobacteria bacterium]MBT4606790.1 response regulator [Thiotrichales bacterium]MBT3471526.1 response regulator [Gammaproteobacteria bacterium]MBT3967159.1 response regulator [Gammaproteobacteria bacterium]MBT4081132.1 response regulator [Gammaproteobacteria bacterium]
MKRNSERVENRRVLAVDDDPLILALYQRLFSEKEADKASQYEEALEGITGLVGGEEKEVDGGVERLQRLPFHLTSCSQGVDAVAAVRRSWEEEAPYAVALVDMRMPPGIDGLETARQIRQMDKEVQLVFVTAYSDHTTDDICAEVGGQVLFFHKPLQMEELYQTVRNCCWSWNQSDELKQLKNNLEYRVELQTQRLRERVRSTDLLHQNAVTREKRIVELNHTNNYLQAYQDLRLLLAREPLPQPRTQAEAEEAMKRSGFAVTLLLVDDSRAIRESYRAQLESIGFVVRLAHDVESGMSAALEDPPDLALIDYIMTGENGDQLVRKLKENPHTTLVLPVLFSNVLDEVSAVVAGWVYWLQKDEGLKVLLQKMALIRDYIVDQRLGEENKAEQLEKELAAPQEEEENRRVLLVDDEQANLGFLLSTLGEDAGDTDLEDDLGQLMDVMGIDPGDSGKEGASAGFDVTTVTQGDDAVTAVLEAQQAGAPFAIALIDMRMPPGIDGLETARQIRQISNEIEIVITTAYSDYTLAEIREVLGNNFSFMGKPFNRDEVSQRVIEGCSKWNLSNHSYTTHQALLSLAEEMQEEIRRRQETERKLEEANKTKDDFLSSMSHELRTPLTTIIGYNEVLREEPQMLAQYREMLDSSILAGKTLLQLVNDILDMSKIRAGKFELNEQPFDLRKVMIDLSELVKVYGTELGVTVRLRIDEEAEASLKTLWIGDDIRISQILFNLLSNAVKFSDGRGEVYLHLGVVHEPSATAPGLKHFKLQVEDHGVGMSQEMLSRLFTPFEQADSSTSRRFGGTGLGLFIAQQLVQMMGGLIRVESQEGVGSTFTVELPLKETDTEVNEESSRLERARATDSSEVPQLEGRVLLAEDTVQLQRLAVLLIEKCGLQVDVAENGREALEMGLQKNYGLILMDMQMPEMDGIEATQALSDQGCKIPVVALTANVMQQHREAFEEAGCRGFLSKPIRRSMLYAVLEEYFPACSNSEDDWAAAQMTDLEVDDGVVDEVVDDEDDLSSLIDDEMWEEFWEYLTGAEKELEEAYEDQNWDELRGVAHAIKGVGSSYGQPEMTKIAAGLQDCAPSGDEQQITPLYQQLTSLLKRKNPNHATE